MFEMKEWREIDCFNYCSIIIQQSGCIKAKYGLARFPGRQYITCNIILVQLTLPKAFYKNNFVQYKFIART